MGFRVKEGCYLEEGGEWVALREVTGWRTKVTQAAQDVLWKWLGRTMYRFEGLQLGREVAGGAWGENSGSWPKDSGVLYRQTEFSPLGGPAKETRQGRTARFAEERWRIGNMSCGSVGRLKTTPGKRPRNR